jgi:N4-gp56 family major capsid protein
MAETTTTLSNNLHSFYFKTLLESAEKKLRIVPLGKKKLHPRKTGKDSYLLKYGNIAEDTSELGEGVTPTAGTIDTNKYTMSIKQYGKYIPLSDLVIATAIDPVMEDVADRLGYCAALISR